MDLIRTLNSVGKSTFVKYYYAFKKKSREECIAMFEELIQIMLRVLERDMHKGFFVKV